MLKPGTELDGTGRPVPFGVTETRDGTDALKYIELVYVGRVLIVFALDSIRVYDICFRLFLMLNMLVFAFGSICYSCFHFYGMVVFVYVAYLGRVVY